MQTSIPRQIVRYAANTVGRDFVVGDIHGCFTLLQEGLDDLGFNPATDRLFAVGDLVDRGPESAQCLDWLAKDWFHSVFGNHEQIAVLVARGEADLSWAIRNGAAWFVALSKQEQGEFAATFMDLPLAIEVEVGDKLYGIVHAACPVAHWPDLHVALNDHNAEAFAQYCAWDRHRIDNQIDSEVTGIDAVIVGHTIVKEPVKLGNVLHIDTGAYLQGGEFTFTVLNPDANVTQTDANSQQLPALVG